MAEASNQQGEEFFPLAIGQGMYTSELSSNIPDGYSAMCYNMVASGDSLENRIGIKRSSLDWKVLEESPGEIGGDSDLYNYFCHINPWGQDSSKPAFMWGAFGFALPGGGANSNTLNLVRAAGTVDANDGFISAIMPNRVVGICQYQDTIYFSLSGVGIHKITAINWATDTVTYTQVVSSAGGVLHGLFTFKDRLWAWQGSNLYYTNIPTVGGLPETWALATNKVPVVGPNGAGIIKRVIPLGNRLAIFTTNGLFTLLVEGAPQSWVFRVLDSKSISTSSQSAFESKAVIYYVNTQGVWATNTQEVTKLSGVIEDQWFLAKGSRLHTIVPYEDGMIVSIAKHDTDQRYFDRDNCRVFYSKLDPIAWTEWNINRNGLGDRPDAFAMIWSTTDKIPTYLNAEPSVYAMVFITSNTPGQNFRAVAQVLVMDGGTDEYVDRNNTVRTLPVGIYLKTKHIDGGNQYRKKRAKMAYLEVYTSDSEHEFTTSWDIDFTTSPATEIRERVFSDFTVGIGSNLAEILADFRYRRCAMNLRASLQTADSQIKIKDITLVQQTGRKSFEQVD